VYIAPARHPLVIAKAVATAAVLSRGRVSFGAGVGWMREEFAAAGQDFTTRGRRLDEMIEILRALWAGGFVEHHGRDYDFDPISLTLVPPAPVPIYIGGESEPALRRAARNDGWIGNLYTEEQALAEVAQLQSYRDEIGTSGRDDFEVLLTLRDPFDVEALRRVERAGVTGIICAPWMPTPDDAGMSTRDVRARIESFAERVVAQA
jgi:alkanesulfonate monooxygenase SsuD/methylene tetrahydromethanopterin reductase-like flavin-dependent oxidoreductase (luciferase family)